MPKQTVHKLPEDEGEGAVKWFGSMNPFQQQETRSQVQYKRKHWPGLRDGRWSNQRNCVYPHILPEGHQEEAFFDPSVMDYMDRSHIAYHTESLNLRSSQVCCLNFPYPLRKDLPLTSRVLSGWLPGLTRVINTEFEYTAPEHVTDWLGEPPGGKRGMNRTSADAAIWWEDQDGRLRVTLLEWKYTERGFGSCGGYHAADKVQKDRCKTVDVRSIEPRDDCYLATGKAPQTKRGYWEHMEEAGIRFRDSDGDGCPLRGPLYQLMRLTLVAYWLGTHPANGVEVAVACFKDNTELMRSPTYLKHLSPDLPTAWRSLLDQPDGFRVLYVEDLMAHCDSLPDVRQSPWRGYLSQRYGV
jgi:hypothetical protein